MGAHTISGRFDHQRRTTGLAFLVALALWTGAAGAQEPSFTYQGQLIEAGTPANGDYDFQFALFDNDGGGTQIGETRTLSDVEVSNGLFTVDLNFGISPFTGQNLFLEVAVRHAGSGSFTTLAPRPFISWAPYAIRSLTASSAESVLVTGVPAGSSNYIQNMTSQQAGTNFNISGDGTVGGMLSGKVVNATTQFNLGGARVLSAPGDSNLFAGEGAGQAAVILAARGQIVEAGADAFFGANAGLSNTTGSFNAFFGSGAGRLNTTGLANSFFGSEAGRANTTAFGNSFFGSEAGQANVTGRANSFFGESAGRDSMGSDNCFFGRLAGSNNTTGAENTMIGTSSNVGSGILTNATAIGARARVDASNALVLGSIKDVNAATADTNVGIGTTAPTARLSVVATGDGARVLHLGTERAWVFKQLGTGAATALELTGDDPNNNNKNFVINTQGNVGIGTTLPDRTLTVNGTADKPGGGSWSVFSDERLKNVKGRFTSGLNAVMQLQPLRYEYKRDNALNIKSEGEHVGFSAQDVQAIIPEAVSTNDKGYLLVNNDPILWTMLNAIKEQQHAINEQRREIERLREDLRQLRAAAARGRHVPQLQ